MAWLSPQCCGSSNCIMPGLLGVLAAETGTDELLITTITHRHDDRVRSYELLADEWGSRVALARVS
jgi:hypothetical protein